MITRGRGKKEQIVNETAEVPFPRIGSWRDHKLTVELAQAMRN